MDEDEVIQAILDTNIEDPSYQNKSIINNGDVMRVKSQTDFVTKDMLVELRKHYQ
jgi:hypothetical protein